MTISLQVFKNTNIDNIKRGDLIRVVRKFLPDINGVVDAIKYQNSIDHSTILFIKTDDPNIDSPIAYRYSGEETFYTSPKNPEPTPEQRLHDAVNHLKTLSLADRKYAVKAILDTFK